MHYVCCSGYGVPNPRCWGTEIRKKKMVVSLRLCACSKYEVVLPENRRAGSFRVHIEKYVLFSWVRNWSHASNLQFYNTYILAILWRNPLIFQTFAIWSNRGSLVCNIKGLRQQSAKISGLENHSYVFLIYFVLAAHRQCFVSLCPVSVSPVRKMNHIERELCLEHRWPDQGYLVFKGSCLYNFIPF